MFETFPDFQIGQKDQIEVAEINDAVWYHFTEMMPIGIIYRTIINSDHKLSYSGFSDKKFYGNFESTTQKRQLRGFGFVSKKSVDRLPCSQAFSNTSENFRSIGQKL